MATPTEDEIEEQLNLALESVAEGRSRWPGMTYEQGVENTLRWLSGDADDGPMSED